MGERLESLGASIHNRSPQHHRMVFSAINGIFFHRRDLLTLTGIKTIDAVVQHPRQHDHDRKNFGYRVAFCFGVIHRAEDPIEFEEAPDFEYNNLTFAPRNHNKSNGGKGRKTRMNTGFLV
jgi:hypothetical protein